MSVRKPRKPGTYSHSKSFELNKGNDAYDQLMKEARVAANQAKHRMHDEGMTEQRFTAEINRCMKEVERFKQDVKDTEKREDAFFEGCVKWVYVHINTAGKQRALVDHFGITQYEARFIIEHPEEFPNARFGRNFFSTDKAAWRITWDGA